MRVLVVEDDAFIAFDLADQLTNCGFEVIGPASRADQALELISASGCDSAVLDINLGAGTSESVAQELKHRGIPFVTLSGCPPDEYPGAFADEHVLSKPVRFSQLAHALREMA